MLGAGKAGNKLQNVIKLKKRCDNRASGAVWKGANYSC